MRKTNFAILMMVCIALAVFITPVSAVSDPYSVVPSGGTVFIGEQGLDVTACVNTSDPIQVSYYKSGDSPGTSQPDKTVTITPTSFYVSPVTFDGKTGNWYIGTGSALAFVVAEPTMDVRVWDAVSKTDVTGKGVAVGSKLDFRIETNLYNVYLRDTTSTTPFDFRIKVTTEEGTVYTALQTTLGSKSIDGVPVSTNLFYWSSSSTTPDADASWKTDAKDGSGSRYYRAGEYTVSIECNENKLKDNYNVEGKTYSKDKVVRIASDTLDIQTSKDVVIRGGQFSITVTGLPSTEYKLFVKSVGSDIAPKIIDYQDGVTKTSAYSANVKTDTTGKRVIGFTTDKNTKDKKWTVRVESLSGDKSDEVTVDVKEGSVSISVSGEGVFFLGEEVKLKGTNSESDTVYFFITGPNLPSAGGKLGDPRSAVTNGDSSTFVQEDVKDDDTFEYKWNTGALSIDAGTYTVFVVSDAKNKDNLGDVQYDTVSVQFRKPFISAKLDRSVVASGDKFFITGNAGAESSEGIAIWIMGKNFYQRHTVSIESDGTFEYEVKRSDTEGLASGQYYVVVQHPMYDQKFDVYVQGDYVVGTYPVTDSRKFKITGAGSLQGSDAASALVNALDDPAVDDTYTYLKFIVSEPELNIRNIPDLQIGSKFKVSGTTNLAVGDKLHVEAISSSFGPTKKNSAGTFSGFTGETNVVAGTGTMNEFEIEIDSTNFIKDEYILTVSSIINDRARSSITFNVLDVPPTTIATPVPTTVATPEPTVVPTTEPTTVATPEPTVVPTTVPTTIPTTVPTPIPPTSQPTTVPTPESPGFGAVVALIGLVIVGYLIVRKN